MADAFGISHTFDFSFGLFLLKSKDDEHSLDKHHLYRMVHLFPGGFRKDRKEKENRGRMVFLPEFYAQPGFWLDHYINDQTQG
jgi:hypothetical protein